MRRTPVFGDLKTDFVFQRIFGSEGHKTALVGFLNDILQLDDDHRVTSVMRIPPEQRRKVSELKDSIVDFKCIDARGTAYVVEMQVFNVEENASGGMQPSHGYSLDASTWRASVDLDCIIHRQAHTAYRWRSRDGTAGAAWTPTAEAFFDRRKILTIILVQCTGSRSRAPRRRTWPSSGRSTALASSP